MNPTLSQIWMDFPRLAARSRRCRKVARWFGLQDELDRSGDSMRIDPGELDQLVPGPGRIVLITRPSGSGKTTLVSQVRSRLDLHQIIDLNGIKLPDRPVIDCFETVSLKEALSQLGRVGLAEAWTYLRTPAELSEGQRWRLRLAIGLCGSGNTGKCRNCSLILCDEFAAVLDRVTAAVVARGLRRAISDEGRFGAILATSHEDLVGALCPEVLVRCDFGAVRIARVQR